MKNKDQISIWIKECIDEIKAEIKEKKEVKEYEVKTENMANIA